MDLNKTILKQIYSHYFRQSCFDCLRYTIYFIGLIGGLLFLGEYEILFPWLCVGYVLICIWRFNLVFLSILEKRHYNFPKILVNVQNIEMDGWLGEYKNENAYIKKYYSEELAVERNKIYCVDESGKKYRLRMIGSRKKMQIVRKQFLVNEEKVYFTYGKYTKIILWMESPESKDSIKYNNVKLLNRKF